MLKQAVILADGSFPQHEIPLSILAKADYIICCDGGAEALVNAGMEPYAIVGDMDSLSDELARRFADRIYTDDNQETNDLTKAVLWCRDSGLKELVIVGATGKRDDHTIGNISLLAEYCEYVNVKLVTDTGYFLPFTQSCRVTASPGQQVSIFSIDPETQITSEGLRYPLDDRKLKNWWEGTLNEALGDAFKLKFTSGRVIVFLKF